MPGFEDRLKAMRAKQEEGDQLQREGERQRAEAAAQAEREARTGELAAERERVAAELAQAEAEAQAATEAVAQADAFATEQGDTLDPEARAEIEAIKTEAAQVTARLGELGGRLAQIDAELSGLGTAPAAAESPHTESAPMVPVETAAAGEIPAGEGAPQERQLVEEATMTTPETPIEAQTADVEGTVTAEQREQRLKAAAEAALPAVDLAIGKGGRAFDWIIALPAEKFSDPREREQLQRTLGIKEAEFDVLKNLKEQPELAQALSELLIERTTAERLSLDKVQQWKEIKPDGTFTEHRIKQDLQGSASDASAVVQKKLDAALKYVKLLNGLGKDEVARKMIDAVTQDNEALAKAVPELADSHYRRMEIAELLSDIGSLEDAKRLAEGARTDLQRQKEFFNSTIIDGRVAPLDAAYRARLESRLRAVEDRARRRGKVSTAG